MATCDNITSLSSSQVTRVRLLGVGIVCGLEVFRDTQCYISITKGVGVTSEGHVICMGDKTLKYYKEYRDPANYFHNLLNKKNNKGTKRCRTWELLSSREEGAESIVPQNAASIDAPFLEDKVVLLYLEDADKMIVRLLLISQLDMWDILKNTCILDTHCLRIEPREEEEISIFDKKQLQALPGEEELYNAVHRKYMLNFIAIRRFGYGQVDISDLYPANVEENKLERKFDYTHAPSPRENFFREYEAIIDDTLKRLDDEIDKLHTHFGCMIDACHCKEKKTGTGENSPCNPLNTDSPTETGLQMHNIKIFNNYFTFINKKWSAYRKLRRPAESIQYFYDFIKDLVKTYNELVHEIYELMDECCPDTDCFPRHLMLGRIKEEVSFQPSLFRQPYLQPPVYNGNADRLQQIRFLHWRMVIMMKCFFVPDWELDDMSDESYYDVLQLENEKRMADDIKDYLPLRITPGRLFNEPLGRQTIPFYYNLSYSPYSLQHYWDFFSTKHNREDHQLSYFCKEEPGYSNLEFVVHPFLFSLEEYPFYRIEGHTGMEKDQALQDIKNLRRRYGLSFQVVAWSFEELRDKLAVTGNDESLFYGIEHVSGVQKGYTFILLYYTPGEDKQNVSKKADGKEGESKQIVIGDFQVPYLIEMYTKDPNPVPPKPLPPQPEPPKPEPPKPEPPKPEPPKPEPIDEEKEKKKKQARELWRKKLDSITAKLEKPTPLIKLERLKEEMIKMLDSIGVQFVEQLASISKPDIALINLGFDIPVDELHECVEIATMFLKSNLLDKIGKAEDADDLKKIKGISDKMEKVLNNAGIQKYSQLALLSAEDITALAISMEVLPHVVKEDWFKEARKLAGNN